MMENKLINKKNFNLKVQKFKCLIIVQFINLKFRCSKITKVKKMKPEKIR